MFNWKRKEVKKESVKAPTLYKYEQDVVVSVGDYDIKKTITSSDFTTYVTGRYCENKPDFAAYARGLMKHGLVDGGTWIAPHKIDFVEIVSTVRKTELTGKEKEDRMNI